MLRVYALLASIVFLALAPDSGAKIKRSMSARREFMQTHICPSTGEYSLKCQNYVVDHVCGLASGGADAPYNMQYQTVEDAKRKDRIENTPLGAAIYCTPENRRKP